MSLSHWDWNCQIILSCSMGVVSPLKGLAPHMTIPSRQALAFETRIIAGTGCIHELW